MKVISPILFIIISIIIFIVVIDPLYGDVKQLRTSVSTYDTALNNSTELQKTRDSLVSTYNGIKLEDKNRLEHFLPDTVSNIELILEIEKIANLHGMPIGTIKFDVTNLKSDVNTTIKTDNNIIMAEKNPADNLPYGVFPMEFVVEGKYDTFLAFLKDLELNLRLIDVKSISFTVPNATVSGNTDLNTYSYTLKVETYWLK